MSQSNPQGLFDLSKPFGPTFTEAIQAAGTGHAASLASQPFVSLHSVALSSDWLNPGQGQQDIWDASFSIRQQWLNLPRIQRQAWRFRAPETVIQYPSLPLNDLVYSGEVILSKLREENPDHPPALAQEADWARGVMPFQVEENSLTLATHVNHIDQYPKVHIHFVSRLATGALSTDIWSTANEASQREIPMLIVQLSGIRDRARDFLESTITGVLHRHPDHEVSTSSSKAGLLLGRSLRKINTLATKNGDRRQVTQVELSEVLPLQRPYALRNTPVQRSPVPQVKPQQPGSSRQGFLSR